MNSISETKRTSTDEKWDPQGVVKAISLLVSEIINENKSENSKIKKDGKFLNRYKF